MMGVRMVVAKVSFRLFRRFRLILTRLLGPGWRFVTSEGPWEEVLGVVLGVLPERAELPWNRPVVQNRGRKGGRHPLPGVRDAWLFRVRFSRPFFPLILRAGSSCPPVP